MLVICDYHMHTPLCRHAVGEPTEYAAQAKALGLKEIGFSDHSPMPLDDFDDWRMRADQLAEYVEKVEKARRDHPDLVIKLALETDYLPGYEDWIRELNRKFEWDYLIGSVHYISETFDIDNPNKLSEWKKRDPFEVWSIYFERLTMAAGSGLFEIIGHADLPKKFGIYPTRDCSGLIEAFLMTCAANNVAIEINTAGLRKDCKEMYPSPAILRQAAALGVKLTFGSDAHAPGEVGKDFPAAISLARECGFTNFLRFTKRKAEVVHL